MAVSARPLTNGVAYSASDMASPVYMQGNYVIPGYLEELLVETSATNGKVKVNTGAAIDYFHLYINDADLELSIGAAANNRIDRIVLRTVDANRTVRAIVIAGVAAANPAPPAIVAETDLPLAWIWVPSGFNPAANTIAIADVHDDRTFKRLGVETRVIGTAYKNDGSLENMMHNSEFIAYSGLAAGNVAPEGWRLTGAPPASILGAAKLTSQIRGRSIRIQGGVGQGMTTQIKAEPGVYTIKGSLNITTGSVRVQVNGVNYDFKRTGAITEFVIRTTPDSVVYEIIIYITANTAGSDFYVGQLMIVQGYVPGHFRNKHETIWLDYPLTDAAWAATAKSTGTTLIDMVASFGPMLTAATPIRGLIVRLDGNDSGSALNFGSMSITSVIAADALSTVLVTGQDNDVVRSATGFVPMIGGQGTTFNVTVNASGAATFDATIQVLGIIT